MREYKVEITYNDFGLPQTNSFTKECSSIEELKQAFLKRFGNINNTPNSVARDKKKVKELTHNARTIEEWVMSVNFDTRWILNIKVSDY